MALKYHGSAWMLAQGPQAADVFDASGLVWYPRSLNTTHQADITKNVDEYERLTSWAAIDMSSGLRVDRITNRGKVDSVGIAVPMRGCMGAPVVSGSGSGLLSTFKHGGALASPVPLLSTRMLKGRIEDNTTVLGPAALPIQYLDFHTSRVEMLAFFMDESDSDLMYEQNTVAIYNGTFDEFADDIVVPALGSKFYRGATVVERGTGNCLKLLSWRLSLMHAADPEFTTVCANQTAASQYTLPTGFEEGAVGCTLDMLLYAKEDNASIYGAFESGVTTEMQIVCGNAGHALTFDIPLIAMSAGEIMKGTTRRPPRQRVTAVGLYSPSDLTGLIATLDNAT